MAAFALAGFAISFMGFRQLVAVMYPIIGYLGMLMLVVLVVASYRKKAKIRKEKEIRNHLLSIVEKAYDPDQDLTPSGQEKRPRNFEMPQLLIMTFSIKIPMHMFVRKWESVRRIRIFILQVSLFLL